MWLRFRGDVWKYLKSTAGRTVLTLPPSALPAKPAEKKMLFPPVGFMGWLTVL